MAVQDPRGERQAVTHPLNRYDPNNPSSACAKLFFALNGNKKDANGKPLYGQQLNIAWGSNMGNLGMSAEGNNILVNPSFRRSCPNQDSLAALFCHELAHVYIGSITSPHLPNLSEEQLTWELQMQFLNHAAPDSRELQTSYGPWNKLSQSQKDDIILNTEGPVNQVYNVNPELKKNDYLHIWY